ncbi:MAG: LLM class flavin-dependent oxidoreductase [Chloroflexi bacterium]|nr:LLM class flavin-dependent oxidoreductase [Chloroflexota bacterium]
MVRQPGGRAKVAIGFKTSPQHVDWATLEATWTAAGELDVFDSAWMNDHLSDPRVERGGDSWEPLTLSAALAHLVPGKWIGHGVLSNTFRHPAVLAKQATAMDHITGGRFILGLGAGWHVGEHDTYGIALPPVGERISRLEAAARSIRALFSDASARPPGVTLDDRFFPLRGAVNLPRPLTPGGPPIWLGGQKPRGLRIAARYGDGWILPAGTDDVPEFTERRGLIVQELEAVGRDPASFTFAAQFPGGTTATEHRAAVARALRFVDAGSTHLILGMPATLGPEHLRTIAREVALPIREALG